MANKNPSPSTRFASDDPRRWRGGSPPLPQGFRDACRLAAWRHLEVVINFITDTETKPELKLKAWEAIANRGYGLPKAQIDVTSEGERVYQPVVYAQPPSATPEEWTARWAPKPKEPTEH